MLERLFSKIKNSNIRETHVALSDKDAHDLENRIDILVNSREFLEASYFVEAITSPDGNDEERARKIYFAARARQGRSRAMASTHWATFRQRLGIGYQNPDTGPAPMSFSYFRKMEARLFIAAGIRKDVVEAIMKTIDKQEQEIEDIKRHRKMLRHGIVKESITKSISTWRGKLSAIQDVQISTNKISAAMTVVANTSVLFTTRDWSVTGTVSTMAGALVAALSE